MIRLLSIIVVFVIFICFIVFNLPNKCDVSFGFMTIKDVPVFLTALSSFVFGMLVAVPMMFIRKKKQPPILPWPSKKAELKSGPDEIKKEDSPYGIN